MSNEKNYTLDWESFGDEHNNYLINLRITRDNKRYLKITRRESNPKSRYHGSSIILFEEDFGFFIEALSMIFTRTEAGERRPA